MWVVGKRWKEGGVEGVQGRFGEGGAARALESEKGRSLMTAGRGSCLGFSPCAPPAAACQL